MNKDAVRCPHCLVSVIPNDKGKCDFCKTDLSKIHNEKISVVEREEQKTENEDRFRPEDTRYSPNGKRRYQNQYQSVKEFLLKDDGK